MLVESIVRKTLGLKDHRVIRVSETVGTLFIELASKKRRKLLWTYQKGGWAAHSRIKPMRNLAWLLRRQGDGILAYFQLRIDISYEQQRKTGKSSGTRLQNTLYLLYQPLPLPFKLPLPQTMHKFL